MDNREQELSELRLLVLRKLGRKTATLFGEIAAVLRLTNREDIREILAEQTEMRDDGKEVPMLGELLLIHGLITPSDIPKILAEQKKQISTIDEEGTAIKKIREEARRLRAKTKKEEMRNER